MWFADFFLLQPLSEHHDENLVLYWYFYQYCKKQRDQFIYIVDIQNVEGNRNTNVVILVNILMDSIYQTLTVLVISLAYKQ